MERMVAPLTPAPPPHPRELLLPRNSRARKACLPQREASGKVSGGLVSREEESLVEGECLCCVCRGLRADGIEALLRFSSEETRTPNGVAGGSLLLAQQGWMQFAVVVECQEVEPMLVRVN